MFSLPRSLTFFPYFSILIFVFIPLFSSFNLWAFYCLHFMPHSLYVFSFFIHILSFNFLMYFMLSIFSSFYFSIHFIILLLSNSVCLPRSFPFLQSLYAYVIFLPSAFSLPFTRFFAYFCIFSFLFILVFPSLFDLSAQKLSIFISLCLILSYFISLFMFIFRQNCLMFSFSAFVNRNYRFELVHLWLLYSSFHL